MDNFGEDEKPKKKLIHINMEESMIESSKMLQNTVLQDDELIFFKAHTGSKNSWDCFIYGMGLKKAKEDIERYKKVLENGNRD